MTDLRMRLDSTAGVPSIHRRFRLFGSLLAYTLLAAVMTWPLLRDMGTRLAGDQGDPLLNTAILVWNATTVPFTAHWYNAPHYFPTLGTTTFTENLLGLYPISTPAYWLTHNPLLAYNLALFLTWPLSGLAGFLLVRRLSGRDDAAFLAGLAFAFNPMRGVAVFHIQTLATYGIPFGLLSLHAYLQEGRRRWLVLFGAAWVQQGFANGYYILYGGLIFGVWILYYLSTRETMVRVRGILIAWAVSSLALVPMLVKYRAVHEFMGMHRSLNEILYFSASPQSWFEVGDIVWLWTRVLPAGKDNLFPGLLVVALVAAGLVAAFRTRSAFGSSPSWHPAVRVVLWLLVLVSAASMAANLWLGPVDTTLGPLPIKIRNLNRGLLVLLIAGAPLAWSSAPLRLAWRSRSHFLFYSLAILVFAVLACGPMLRVHERPILDPAPYGLLMALPGFNELRVPTQIKMIHLLCLCVAASLAYARLFRRATTLRSAALIVLTVGLTAEGWLAAMPLDAAVPSWSEVEPADRTEPILELPLRPGYDGPPTLRAAIHHRRVMNGVSGYDPPYYVALKAGLAAHDPATRAAITSLGAIDIVVDSSSDPDGAYLRYAADAPGAVKVATDGVRTTFRLPQSTSQPDLGPVLRIADVRAVRDVAHAASMSDGDPLTGWGDYPQKPDGWVIADLGTTQTVAGVTNAIGDYLLDFPRRLAIETSLDGVVWESAWEGPTYAETFLGFVRAPREADLRFSFEARAARYVRLRQLESFSSMWRVSELKIHGPAPQR